MLEQNKNLKCTNCGLCREACPAFKVLKDELVTPRGKNNIADAFLANTEKIDGKFFYDFCNGCQACVVACPLKIGFDVIKVREQLVDEGFVLEGNKIMAENIKKFRNPFGENLGDDKNGKIPDKLYCC